MSIPAPKLPDPALAKTIWRIVLVYAVLATLWIALSDELLGMISADPAQIVRLAIIKGWAFVLVTALLLASVLRHYLAAIAAKNEDLQERERNYREIFNATSEAIFIQDPDSAAIIDVNEPMLAMYGFDSKDEVLAGNIGDLSANEPPYGQAEAKEIVRRALSEGPLTVEWLARKKNGEKFWVELSLRSSTIGGTGRLLAVARDITKRKCAEDELRQLASTDSLTGLPNRRHFIGQLEEELARVQRHDALRAAVLMLDLDHFKLINDRHGHATGDAVLQHFATLIGDGLRKIDSVGRIGGEEFAIILAGADTDAALSFAERLRLKVEQTPLMQGGRPVPVTVSIGIAAMSAADVSADAALIRADQALYRAKQAGRNRVEAAV